MEDILPEPVLTSLRDHYYAGVTKAENWIPAQRCGRGFRNGALGQSLFTPGIMTVQFNGSVYQPTSATVGRFSPQRVKGIVKGPQVENHSNPQ
jgi:hypothetical protein